MHLFKGFVVLQAVVLPGKHTYTSTPTHARTHARASEIPDIRPKIHPSILYRETLIALLMYLTTIGTQAWLQANYCADAFSKLRHLDQDKLHEHLWKPGPRIKGWTGYRVPYI